MIFFKYRRFLEKENEELKQERKELQARIDKLTEALVPVLRRMGHSVEQMTAKDVVEHKAAHSITRIKDAAKCVCGWEFNSEDPAELQQKVSEHYRNNMSSLRAGRKSWPQIKQAVENQQEEA